MNDSDYNSSLKLQSTKYFLGGASMPVSKTFLSRRRESQGGISSFSSVSNNSNLNRV